MVGPPIEPYRQGAFDGLCGVYALVNAVQLLQPGLEHAAAEDLFIYLVECLEAKDLPLSTAVIGLGQRELRRLTHECRDYAAEHLELPLVVDHLPLARISLAAIWTGMQAALTAGAAIVVGLTGRERHWTVAYRVTARTIRLVDSGDLDLVLRSRCTVAPTIGRYQLDPADIIVMRRGTTQRRRRQR